MRGPLISGWVTQGPKVAEFERAFTRVSQTKHAIAVTSATAGLHLALLACGVGPGDEVIVPSFTWVATANAVLYCGAKVVFCDVDRKTCNIDVADALSRVTSDTKAIVPVHLFGLCADVPSLRTQLPERVRIIEDAACAAGGSLGNRSAGALGDIGVFSFHPRKSITTGEGGMITTSDDTLAEMCVSLRNHGASVAEEVRHRGPKPYLLADFNLLGFNYRMTDLQGAVGSVQLGKLEGFITERQAAADYYRKHLSDLSWLRLPQEPAAGRHAWQAYVTYVDPDRAPLPRNILMERLNERGVSTRPGTHAVHMLGYYRNNFGFRPADFPAARDCDAHTMAIPLHNKMSVEDYDYVIEALRSQN